jgi:hypothetical protein
MGVIGLTTREDIYTAFWNLVSSDPVPNTPPGSSSASPFVTKSRLLRHWNQVPAEQQPALFMAETTQGAVSDRETITGIPYRWKLRAKLWLYSQRGADDTVIPAITMNVLIQAVVNAIRNPEIGEPQTLGGLVKSVRIGDISTDEGQLGSQAISVVPVEIFTAEL